MPRAADTAGRPRRVLAQVRLKRQRDRGEQPRRGEGDSLSVWLLLSSLGLGKIIISHPAQCNAVHCQLHRRRLARDINIYVFATRGANNSLLNIVLRPHSVQQVISRKSS